MMAGTWDLYQGGEPVDVKRKRFRDIRIGEMIVTGDSREPWAIVEDVQPFPTPVFGVRGCVRVTLVTPCRTHEMPMRLDGFWDVAT